ncbi:MAG: PEP-CTERM sorting domain-containing protein [Verrucomicrobiales bacterium]
MLLRNMDFTRIQFTGSHSESILAGSGVSDITYDGGSRLLYDPSVDSFGGTEGINSATGTILFNGGGLIDTIQFRVLDNGNTPSAVDGWNFTFATPAVPVPEPGSLLLFLAAAPLALARRRR